MYSKDIRHQEVTAKKATEETTCSAWTKTSVMLKKIPYLEIKWGFRFEPRSNLNLT